MLVISVAEGLLANVGDLLIIALLRGFSYHSEINPSGCCGEALFLGHKRSCIMRGLKLIKKRPDNKSSFYNQQYAKQS